MPIFWKFHNFGQINPKEMSQLLNRFSNGSAIEFDEGCFDKWCVFVSKADGERFAPLDTQYFSRLKKIAEKHGPQIIYNDFVVIYNRTTKEVNTHVFDLIKALSKNYCADSLEIEIWFSVLYAGMIAEENKENAILKKRIKRLGMHQLLINNFEPEAAATFSKGKKWRELDGIMETLGF